MPYDIGFSFKISPLGALSLFDTWTWLLSGVTVPGVDVGSVLSISWISSVVFFGNGDDVAVAERGTSSDVTVPDVDVWSVSSTASFSDVS